MPYIYSSPEESLIAGTLRPLDIAAYITIATVAIEPLMTLVYQHGGRLPLHPWPGFAAQLLVLALFVAHGRLVQRDAGLAPRRAVVLGEAAAALIVCWAFHGYLQPALLCIVASQLVLLYPPRGVLALMAPAGAVLAAIYFQAMVFPEAATLLVAYAGFCAFSAIMARYAVDAQTGRNAALRINAELLATRRLLEESARAEERLRLSRELHDIAGHKLTAMKMQLALQSRAAGSGQTGGLQQCERMASELLEDIRGVVSTLREHEGVDLQAVLLALDPGLPRPAVRFELDPAVRVADTSRAEALLHCAQEGLTNALRHSAAGLVRVSLQRWPEGVVLAVEDDGRGKVALLSPGNGLRGLRERLAEVGGRLELRDLAPRGLVLRAVLPEPGLAPELADRSQPALEALRSRYCPWSKSATPGSAH